MLNSGIFALTSLRGIVLVFFCYPNTFIFNQPIRFIRTQPKEKPTAKSIKQ